MNKKIIFGFALVLTALIMTASSALASSFYIDISGNGFYASYSRGYSGFGNSNFFSNYGSNRGIRGNNLRGSSGNGNGGTPVSISGNGLNGGFSGTPVSGSSTTICPTGSTRNATNNLCVTQNLPSSSMTPTCPTGSVYNSVNNFCGPVHAQY